MPDAGRNDGVGIRRNRQSPYRFLLFLPTLLLGLLFLQPRKNPHQVDAPQYYAVGHIVRAGEIARLYDHDSYRDFAALAKRSALYYNRPAFHALALVPFAYVSYDSFLLMVRVGSYALLGFALWLIPRWFPARAHSRALLVAFQPFLWTVGMGQDTIILALIIAYGIHLILHRRKDLSGGAVMALAVFKPHIVWAIPFALAGQRRWRALAGFAAVGSLLALLSFALIGPHGVQQWIAVLKAPTTDVSSEYMGNLREIAVEFGLPASIAFGLIAIVCFVVCLNRSLPAALAAALFIGPLLSPHSYLQDYSPAAISALIAPNAVLCYLVLIPWQYFWRGPASGIPYAITGAGFLFVMAFWPVVRSWFHKHVPQREPDEASAYPRICEGRPEGMPASEPKI